MQVPTDAERRLRELVSAFLSENQHINLSALRTEDQCWIGNVLDSLALLGVLPKFSILPTSPPGLRRASNSQFTILDVGTGGGFPLLPLAITLPDAKLTGLDATQKKIDAVRRIADALELTNVELIAARAEILGHDPLHRETYDIVTARAVAPISVLLEYASPFAKVGGRVVLWKSMHIEEELKDSLLARAEVSCHLVDQHEYVLPGDWGKRQLLVFEKSATLSKKYPRAVGVPGKKPIA
ncbi:MAG: 16S rRNA (guanine527-N7)-methyltransferase [Candidatus Peregrinibacteria bacterium Greene0416_19]|nr:MAG: 16S rRNA (guanine527-N7)-methyltransferase [Candidatus Peregrinibacteria bacterium Greene0416_19]